jgi:hypothetical protein
MAKYLHYFYFISHGGVSLTKFFSHFIKNS